MTQETEQFDTAFYIFKKIFHVRIPYIQMLSVEEIKLYGMPNSGHAGYDREAANELRDIMIPISKMVEYFQQGAQIYIPKQSDINEIYEHITDHLLAWKNEIQRSLHIGKAPIDELKQIDLFANAIYEHAKHQFTDEIIGTLLGQSNAVKQVSRASLLIRPLSEIGKAKNKRMNIEIVGDNPLANNNAKIEPEDSVVEDNYPERESIHKFLEDREKNPGYGHSLNGPHNNPANAAKTPSRASLASGGGLSYQSLVSKGKPWK